MAKKLLIDYDILKYRYGFAAQKKLEDGTLEIEPEQKVIDALQYGIRRMLQMSGCDEYVGYLSGPTNFRYDIDPEYKANRKDAEKPFHYENIHNYLVEVHGAIVTDGDEADDAIARHYESAPEGTYIIASVDKDFKQISGLHYDIVKETLTYVDPFSAAFHFWCQMLTGDRVDNVKGIPKIGPVRAKKALEHCKDEDEMADAVARIYRDTYGEEGWLRAFDKNYALLKLGSVDYIANPG